ncbi:MAG: hypothetical protein L3J89_03575 [Gammaproteobacteria bacterium]|nr:hypothetical protein [Gammaproteobacteria bacterium]
MYESFTRHSTHPTATFWLNHLQACEASGKGIAAYARDHDLKGQSMYASKKIRINKGILPPPKRAQFQRVQVVTPVAANEWLIQLSNGVSVSFSGVADKGVLERC